MENELNISEQLAMEVIINEMLYDGHSTELIDLVNETTTLSSTEQLVALIEQNGETWDASVFMCCQGTKCQFWKKCMTKKCSSEAEAKIVTEYGKSVAQINHHAANHLTKFTNLNWN